MTSEIKHIIDSGAYEGITAAIGVTSAANISPETAAPPSEVVHGTYSSSKKLDQSNAVTYHLVEEVKEPSSSSIHYKGYDFVVDLSSTKYGNLYIHATREDLNECYEVSLTKADVADISPYLGEDLSMLYHMIIDGLRERNLEALEIHLSVTEENDVDIESTLPPASALGHKSRFLWLKVNVHAVYQQFGFHIYIPSVDTKPEEWLRFRLKAVQSEVRQLRQRTIEQEQEYTARLTQSEERLKALFTAESEALLASIQQTRQFCDHRLDLVQQHIGGVVMVPPVPFPLLTSWTVLDVDQYHPIYLDATFTTLSDSGGVGPLDPTAAIMERSEDFKRHYVMEMLTLVPHMRHSLSRRSSVDDSLSRLHEMMFTSFRKNPKQLIVGLQAFCMAQIANSSDPNSAPPGSKYHAPSFSPLVGSRSPLGQTNKSHFDAQNTSTAVSSLFKEGKQSSLALGDEGNSSNEPPARLELTIMTEKSSQNTEHDAKMAAIETFLSLAIDSRVSQVIKEHLSLKKIKEMTSRELSPLCLMNSLEVVRLLNCRRIEDLNFLRGSCQTLRILIVAGCSSLTNLSVLNDMESLEELDVSDCPRITELELLRIRHRIAQLSRITLIRSGVNDIEVLGSLPDVEIII